MKTTVELPDELMRAVKMRAVAEDRKLKDMLAELLEKGLAQPSAPCSHGGKRMVFPVARAAHPAAPGQGMTPRRLKELLLEEETDAALGRH